MRTAETIALILAVVITYRLVSVRLWPYRRCYMCWGRKTNWGSNAARWGTCKRCRGTGRLRRWGAPSGRAR